MSVLLAESHKNDELKSPHRLSTRGLVADFDTVFKIERSIPLECTPDDFHMVQAERKVEKYPGQQPMDSQTGQVHTVNMCSSVTHNNYIKRFSE